MLTFTCQSQKSTFTYKRLKPFTLTLTIDANLLWINYHEIVLYASSKQYSFSYRFVNNLVFLLFTFSNNNYIFLDRYLFTYERKATQTEPTQQLINIRRKNTTSFLLPMFECKKVQVLKCLNVKMFECWIVRMLKCSIAISSIVFVDENDNNKFKTYLQL